jgi:hypothetical protein
MKLREQLVEAILLVPELAESFSKNVLLNPDASQSTTREDSEN